MNCERIREQIPEALAGRLDEADREALVEHLEGCAFCRTEVAQLNAVWRGLESMKAGAKMFFGMMTKAFPDVKITPTTMMGVEDYVVTECDMTGTNKGAFMGKAPTKKSIDVKGVDVFQVKDGKMVHAAGATSSGALFNPLFCERSRQMGTPIIATVSFRRSAEPMPIANTAARSTMNGEKNRRSIL